MIERSSPKTLVALVIATAALGACTRFRSPEGGLAAFNHASPLRLAPDVGKVPSVGLRGAYHFVTQGASQAAYLSFIREAEGAGLEALPLTVVMNGVDTVFVTGKNVLRSQADVDAEFSSSCRLSGKEIYLSHVRYNPFSEEDHQMRER